MKTRRNQCVFMLCLAMILFFWAITLAGQPSNADATAQSASHSTITGEWQGTIARQHLILKIEQPADGPLKGTLMLPDQGNANVPIDTTSWGQNAALRLDLKSLGATYEGKLSADGTEIGGTWQQGGASLPLLFHRPGASAKFTLKPRTQGKVALEPCRSSDGNVEGLCGKYEVFENRQSKTGRRIALNIMLLPAMAEKSSPDPFFALAGGPGQSATEAFPLAGYVPKIRSLRDVVLVDQRGTGKSNPLQCPLQKTDDPQSVIGDPYPSTRFASAAPRAKRRPTLLSTPPRLPPMIWMRFAKPWATTRSMSSGALTEPKPRSSTCAGTRIMFKLLPWKRWRRPNISFLYPSPRHSRPPCKA